MGDTLPPRARRAPSAHQARLAANNVRTHAARRIVRDPQTGALGVPGWLLAVCSAIAVLTAVALLLVAALRTPVAPVLRLSVPLVWALASGLVFVPLARRLDMPGLNWQGVVGWTLLSYVVAFVPAPRGALLDLPELPSYLLLFLAVFYAVAATAVPLTWLLARRLDDDLRTRRARRQAYAIASLAVVVLAMAALRVLTPWAFALLLVVLILAEALLISQWEDR